MSLKAGIAGSLVAAYLATFAFGELAVREYWRAQCLDFLGRLDPTPAHQATISALNADVRAIDHELRIKRLFPVAPFVVYIEFDATGACGYGSQKLMLWYGSGARVLVDSI